MSPFDITRQYNDGGGFLPSDTAYRTCVCCGHDLVDEPIQNKSIVLNNRQTQQNYLARLNEYNINNPGNNNNKMHLVVQHPKTSFIIATVNRIVALISPMGMVVLNVNPVGVLL